jgi:hypothetical protein
MSNLYRGEFNWQGEIHKLYTYAKNREKAFVNFSVQLSKILDYTGKKVSNYFKMDKRLKFKIILLKKGIPEKYKERKVKFDSDVLP